MNNKKQANDQIFLIDEIQDATLYEQTPLDSSYQKNANQITQSLLDAIRIVSHKQIQQANFNKIVKANIINCEDELLGKYKVQYQDGSWYAYNENLSNQYTPGTSVYVMVPNSNMQDDKIIIGSSKQVEQTYISIKNELDDFISNGYNLLSLNDNIINNQNNWKLWSEYPEEIILYQDSDKLNSILAFDETSFNIQKNNTDRLFLQATIQTLLPPSRQYGGNYGIGIDIIFRNKTNQIQEVQRSYILDVDNIVGDPYILTNPTSQKLLFEIDGENFIKINKIYLFIKDFTNNPENEKGNNYNVVISNLSLTSGREVSEQEKNGVLLSLKSLKGFIFGDNSLSTDTRQIQAEMKVQLKEIKLKNQKLPFYWFVENVRVTSNSDGYCKYGGQGWYCLNQKSEKNEYMPSNYKYTITCGDIYTLETKYKCVVLYNGISYSKEFVITKLNSEYKVELSSSNGTEFYKDIGETTLTCTVFGKNNNEFQQISSNNFDFVWTSINKFGNFESLQSQNNYIENLNISTIVDFTTFKCSVFQKSNSGALIGTATILITNKAQNEQDYSLTINNGNQVFKYNVNGVSPTSKQNEIPQIIPALTFTLYDNLGNPIPQQDLRDSTVTWIIPSNNTLLISNETGGIENLVDETISYTNIGNVFSYSIANNYDFNKINNNIILKVIYNDLVLRATTNFSFLKQGENGTNGTDFVCKVVPKVISGEVPINPTIYYDGSNITLNWDAAVDEHKWFEAQLWHNGERIFHNIVSGRSDEGKDVIIVQWEILRNKYANQRFDDTNLEVTKAVSSENWSFNFLNTTYNSSYDEESYSSWMPANIIKVTLRYDNMTYYATLPVIICRIFNNNYDIKLKDYSGFREVLYNSNGQSAKYNSHAPFELIVSDKNNGNNNVTENMRYKWYYMGSVQYKNSENNNWYKDVEITFPSGKSSGKWLLRADPLNSNPPIYQRFLKPADNYNGECVNTALACRINFENGTTCAWIHISIHMMRNRFESTAINGWDGNSVSLGDNEEGMILAPQVGAGIKDNNNKFTGIVMGSTKRTGITQTGLFGYHEGLRSIFLDAETGKAIFGEDNKSQIKIDPTDGTAKIQSGNYVPKSDNIENSGTGMLIDFATPQIQFGSGNFQVDSRGYMIAKGGGKIAGWWIDDYNIRNLSIEKNGQVIIPARTTGINSVGCLPESIDTSKIVQENGSRRMTVKIPPVETDSNFTNENKAAAFWAGGDNNPKFLVTHDGYLKASQASIGKGINPIFIGGNNNESYIFSGKKSTKITSQNGFYLGTDGLGIGSTITVNNNTHSKFQVNVDGTFYASQGIIGTNNFYWNIGNNGLMSGKNDWGDAEHEGIFIGSRGISCGSTAKTNNGTTTYTTPFYVQNNGNFKAVKGQIANWIISENSIRTNGASDRYYSSATTEDTVGIYFGNQGLRMGANFHVDKDGNLYANNGEFTGKITATSGTFNGSVYSYGTETGYKNRYACLMNNRLFFANSDTDTIYAYITTNEDNNSANENGQNDLKSTTGIRAQNSHLLFSAWGDQRSNIALVAQNRIIIAPHNTGLIGGGYAVWVRDGSTLTMCTVQPSQIVSDGGGTSSLRYKNISHELTSKEIQNFYFVKPIWGSYKEDYLKEKNQEYLKNVFMPMLIAEDIEKIYPKAVYYNKDGQVQNYYDHLVVSVHQKMLIDQHQEIKNLKQQIELLKQQIKGE